MNDTELRQKIDALRVMVEQGQWRRAMDAATAIAKEAESRSRVNCTDCNRDWGHGYCGVCKGYGWVSAPETPTSKEETPAPTIALDVSLEKVRALHRVWRALNDGDCPKCHQHRPATEMFRGHEFLSDAPAIMCPSCHFGVAHEEIREIEKLFAPAMDAAVAIFEEWRKSRSGVADPPRCPAGEE